MERADNINRSGDFTVVIGVIIHVTIVTTNVYGWLGEIGMAAYASLLQNNGFDSLTYCAGSMLDDETLNEIGITSADDRRYVYCSM